MLAYVGAGRLRGYVEEHMNAWDCLAALLLIEEAGGKIVRPDAQTAVANGAMVIAGGAGVFGALEALVKDPFGR